MIVQVQVPTPHCLGHRLSHSPSNTTDDEILTQAAQVYIHTDGLTMLVQGSCPNIDMRKGHHMEMNQSLRTVQGHQCRRDLPWWADRGSLLLTPL
jgi:hypothetical protein